MAEGGTKNLSEGDESTDDVTIRAILLKKLPVHIVNLLNFTGFLEEDIFKTISHDDLNYIEEVAKNEIVDIISENNYEDYFGQFKVCPKKFKLFLGHRKTILNIAQSLKTENRDGQLFSHRTSKQKTSSLNCNPSPSGKENLSELDKIEDKINETAVIKSMIQNYIENYTKELSKEADSGNKFENMNLAEDDLYNVLTDGSNLVCYIKCILCKNKILVKKLKNRWVLSNFYRHFQNHDKENGQDKKRKKRKVVPTTKVNTISTYFTKQDVNNEKERIAADDSVCDSVCGDNPGPSHQLDDIILIPDTSHNIKKTSSVLISIENFVSINQPQVDHENNNTDFTEGRFDETVNKRIAIISARNQKQSSKWSSRASRRKLKRIKLERNQTLLTDYLLRTEEIKSSILSNEKLNLCFSVEIQRLNGNLNANIEGTSEETNRLKKGLLQKLQETALCNTNKSSSRLRYKESLKDFCSYIYILGGKLTYETLQSNLKGTLPSVTTVKRHLSNEPNLLNEGEFRFEELKMFLDKRKLPPVVWISEDATRIISKVEYYPKQNKNVGFVLPLKDGLPDTNYFKATSFNEIKRQFSEEEISSYAYVIMAQPLIDGTPSFCLAVFGTNNKFTYLDVQARWDNIKEKASASGISILGFSSDGDNRLLKSMRIGSGLGITSSETSIWPWFHCNINTNHIYIQDTIHILTKLKTRLTKPSIFLPFGNKIVSSGHIQYLIKNFSKDQHMLVESDINSEDKMNYKSVEKICSQLVINLLEQQVPESEGTVLYLKIMNDIKNSFLKKELPVSERLYLIWHVVFLLRIWRNWIHSQSEFSLTDNFISLNAYICIELNAHALVVLITMFKMYPQKLTSDMFVTWLMSSQPCEQLFRTTRSMTTTFSTVVNFTILDLINRINKLQFLQNATNDLKNDFNFPRENGNRLGNESQPAFFDMLNDNDIENIITKAQNDAKEDAYKLGIKDVTSEYLNRMLLSDISETTSRATSSSLQSHETEDNPISEAIIQNNSEDSILEVLDESVSELSPLIKLKDKLLLNNYTIETDNDEYFKNGPYIKLHLETSSSVTIKKSSLCWLFANKHQKLSSDRLRRVQQQTILLGLPINTKVAEKKDSIEIGDWCIFNNENKFLVGSILTFKYYNAKGKKKQYTLSNVHISKKNVTAGIGCLSNWYSIEESGKLNVYLSDFLDVKNYIMSIPEPKINFINNKIEIKLNENVLSTVNKLNSKLTTTSNFQRSLPNLELSSTSNSDSTSDLSSDDSLLVLEANEEKINKSTYKNVAIELENYFAVYYDKSWYIGRVIEKEKEKFRIKFLKENLQQYMWPKIDDVQLVEEKYIFYGPIKLVGNEPFTISRTDLINVNKTYKRLKQSFK